MSSDPYDKNGLTFSDLVQRNALFWFILKYGDRITEDIIQKNYLEWARFVWKMVKNDELKNVESVFETMTGLHKIIEMLPSPDQLEESSTLKTIGEVELTDDVSENFKNTSKTLKVSGYSKRQLKEEIIKARLRLDAQWNATIVKAENYVQDGQIWIVLECCKQSDESYNIDCFKKAFEIYKTIFDRNRKINDGIGWHLYERALLNLDSDKDHLKTMSATATGTKIFLKGDFKEALLHENDTHDAFGMVRSLTIEIMDSIDAVDTNSVKGALEKRLKVQEQIEYSWKYIMKRFDLLNREIQGIRFSNGFEPKINDGSLSFTAIYTNPNRRNNSGELYSFALAVQLRDADKDVQYTTAAYDKPYYTDGCPNRYFTVDQKTVWFDPENQEFMCRLDNTNIISLGDFATAFKQLCGHSLPL